VQVHLFKSGRPAAGKWIGLLSVLLVFVLVTAALAGEGDGSGGGSGEPLTLVNSSPADGQTDVPLSSSIVLEFSKNVINMSVKDNNVKCFSLYQGEQPVEIQVVMADDQIAPDQKRLVTLQPVQSLQPGTRYSLKISRYLTSKSGASLERGIVISFTTSGVFADNAASEPNSPEAAPEQEELRVKEDKQQEQSTARSSQTDIELLEESDGLEMESESGSLGPVESENPSSSEEELGVNEEESQDHQQEESNTSYLWLLLALPVLLGTVVYLKKHSSKN